MAKIRILGATLKSFAWHPQADDDKKQTGVIQIEANLTKRMAERFGKGWVFDEKGVARSFDGRLGVGLTVDGGTITLGDRAFEIARAWKFYIFGAKDGDNDLTLKFDCRIQITEGILELLAWCCEKNADTFGTIIAPNQMAFDDDEVEAEDEEPAEESKPGPTLAPQATMKRQRQANLSEVTQ